MLTYRKIESPGFLHISRDLDTASSEIECGDIVEVLWPRKGCGYHVMLGHNSPDTVIIAITNDKEYRNTVVPISSIQRIVEKSK